MSSAAILALVVVLNGTAVTTQETVAVMPADQCQVAAKSIWTIPAETVERTAQGAVPALDAFCVDPETVEAPGVVSLHVLRPH